jgi:hypothetical protein
VHLLPPVPDEGVLGITDWLRDSAELLELKLNDLFGLIEGLVKMPEMVVGEGHCRGEESVRPSFGLGLALPFSHSS